MIPIAKPQIGQEEKNRVLEVLDSGGLAAGKYVDEFEQEFAKYLGSEHVVATSSGTTALHMAVEALGLGQGDKVITTPFSFIATANAIRYTGAIPIFADIDPENFNLSPSSVRRTLEEHPDAKAILVVHLYGQAADMAEIMIIAKEHKLLVIEDCAQAHGAEYCGQKVGTFGNTGMFSFYPTKNMTTGEGGIMIARDLMVAEKAKSLINHGQKQRYHHEFFGYNFRMTNIHAAIGIEQLKKLDMFNAQRRSNANYYGKYINNNLIKLPIEKSTNKHVYHQYTLKIKSDRENFIKHLQENEIGYGIHYPLLITQQPEYVRAGLNEGKTPVALLIAEQVVSIPVHPALSKSDLDKVVETINNYRG